MPHVASHASPDRLISAIRNLYRVVFEKPGQVFNSPLRSTLSPRDTITPSEYQAGSSEFARFPSLLVSGVEGAWLRDTFAGTDGADLNTRVSDAGHVWTVNAGAASLLTNQVRFTGSGTQIATLDGSKANGTIQALITSLDASSIDAGIIFRFSDTSNYWKAVWEPDTSQFVITKIVAGIPTVVHTDVYPFTVGSSYTIKVWLDGNNIYAYINNVLRTIRTDTFNNTATKHGIIQVGTSTEKRFDSFLGMPGEYRLGEFNISPSPESFGANLVLWLSADHLNGLAHDGDITTWTDKGDGGNNMTQSVTADKPNYLTDPGEEVNGYPVVEFDGVSDFLEHLTPNDVFDVSTTADWSIILFVHTVNVSSIGTWIAIVTNSTNFIYIHRIEDEVGWRVDKSGNTQRRQRTDSNVLATTADYLITITKQGNNDVSVRVNAVVDASRASQSDDTAPNVSGTTLLGRVKTADVTLYSPDHLIEVIVVDRLLTAQEITDMETFIKWKYSH